MSQCIDNQSQKMKCAAVFFVSLVALCSATLPYGMVVAGSTVKLPYTNPIIEKYLYKNLPIESLVPKTVIGEEYYKPYLLNIEDQIPQQYYESVYGYPKGVLDILKPYGGYYGSKIVPYMTPYTYPYVMKYQTMVPEMKTYYPVPQMKYPVGPMTEVPSFKSMYTSPMPFGRREGVITVLPTSYKTLYPTSSYMPYGVPYKQMVKGMTPVMMM